jgi:hypothetical protein
LAKNRTLTGTVGLTGTTSDPFSCGAGSQIPLALLTPATLTSVTFKFQGSIDGTSYYPIYYESTEYSVTVATSRWVALDRRAFEAVRYIKITSNASEAALRTIGVIIGE